MHACWNEPAALCWLCMVEPESRKQLKLSEPTGISSKWGFCTGLVLPIKLVVMCLSVTEGSVCVQLTVARHMSIPEMCLVSHIVFVP